MVIFMKDKRKITEKSNFRNTILISIPTAISAIGVIISLIPTLSNPIKYFLLFLTIIGLLVLIGFVLFFSKQDDKLFSEYEKQKEEIESLMVILAHLENNLKTSKFTINSFSEMSEAWAKNINAFSNTVLMTKKVSNKSWDKIKYFDLICSNCKNMIEKYCDDNDDSKISVGFVMCEENNNGDKMIHMISHSNPESTRPNACKYPEKLSESIYHHADLIKENCSDIEVAVNNEEILRIFKKISKNTDLSKYTQYIAIPVYCTSNKLLGIFQVVTKYNYVIEENRVELLTFAQQNILPYSNLIVLVDKINKGLYINPCEIIKEQ